MNDFDQTLDDCLAQIASGASTTDECLARHPGYAAQLKPLLGAAILLEQGREVRPSPAFKARARANLTLHMQAHPRRRRAAFSYLRLAASLSVFLLVFLVSGTALAQRALPGDALYGWKLASEQAWRASASDPVEVDLVLLDRRAAELTSAAQEPARFSEALAGYQNVLDRLTVQESADEQARLLTVLQSQQEMFVNAGISVPALDAYLNAVQPATPTPIAPTPTLPRVVPDATREAVPSALPTLVPTFVPTVVPTAQPTFQVPTIPVFIPTPPIPTLPRPPLP